MLSGLLINLRYENINGVAKSLIYHSSQKRLFLAKEGSYVFFISFNKITKNHEVVGYFIVKKQFIDGGSKWGKYSLKGRNGKFIKGIKLLDIIEKIEVNIGNKKSTAKEIGMVTQTIRKLSERDIRTIISFLANIGISSDSST